MVKDVLKLKCPGWLEGWKAGRPEGWKAGRLEGRKAGRPEVWKAGRLEGWKVRGSQPGEDSRCHFDDFSGFRGPRPPETDRDLSVDKPG